MTTAVDAPADDELLAVLTPALGQATLLERKPYAYATSFPLEELTFGRAASEPLRVIFKDLAWERLLPEARATKPRWLHEPRRTIDTHLALLAPRDIGPPLVAAVADDPSGRYWLITEKVDGVELWQVGELEVWESVAAWLARFHQQLAGCTEEARAASPRLLTHDDTWFRQWADRARSVLERSNDTRASTLLGRLDRYDTVIEALCARRPTFVHGELYASNVLVREDEDGVDVWPIDWELAAIGPAVIDLSALASGWPLQPRARLIDAYHRETAEVTRDELVLDVERARLHLALQWLGWSSDWRPPAEHARDWLGEALEAAEVLGL